MARQSTSGRGALSRAPHYGCSTMVQARPQVRAYRPGDAAAVAALLYESSGGMYDRYAGSRKLAERALAERCHRGHHRERRVVWVAELDGAGRRRDGGHALDEWTPRAHAFLRVTLRSIPPWRWPRGAVALPGKRPHGARAAGDLLLRRLAGHGRAAGAGASPGRCSTRRSAGARARAATRWRSTPGSTTKPARALYLSAGFEEVAYTPARQRAAGWRVAAEGARR